MLDFFEWHSFSPYQRFAKDINAGVELNRKRIEAHIAISKSIEKAQNIPLTTMEQYWNRYLRRSIKLMLRDSVKSKIQLLIQPNQKKKRPRSRD